MNTIILVSVLCGIFCLILFLIGLKRNIGIMKTVSAICLGVSLAVCIYTTGMKEGIESVRYNDARNTALEQKQKLIKELNLTQEQLELLNYK